MEKVENEATTKEMRRKIAFLKSTKSQATCASHGQGMSFGNVAQVTNNQSNTSLGTISNKNKQNMVGNTSNANT